MKVYDQETNLDDLAKKILERKMEGLVWNNEPKKVDVAYGMQKLQIGCVIEDEKILTDDIFDPIAEWPEVQSVDMTSMQKLWCAYLNLEKYPNNSICYLIWQKDKRNTK